MRTSVRGNVIAAGLWIASRTPNTTATASSSGTVTPLAVARAVPTTSSAIRPTLASTTTRRAS